MVALPVTGREVLIRQPTGVDDLFLLETPVRGIQLALAMAARLVTAGDGREIAWGSLPLTDLDAALLLVRQVVSGDLIRTDIVCPAADCGARIDVTFRVSEYLAHHTPGKTDVPASDEDGWYRFDNGSVWFRLPCGNDLVSVERGTNLERALIRSCIRPFDVPTQLRRRMERAMERLAPNLAQEVQGTCRECGDQLTMFFDPQQFTLTELSQRATLIYDEVHLLASHFHWPEDHILALPRKRRTRYADIIRQARSVA